MYKICGIQICDIQICDIHTHSHMRTTASADILRLLPRLSFSILYGAHCFIFARNFHHVTLFRFVRLENGGPLLCLGFGFGGDFLIMIMFLFKRYFSLFLSFCCYFLFAVFTLCLSVSSLMPFFLVLFAQITTSE